MKQIRVTINEDYPSPFAIQRLAESVFGVAQSDGGSPMFEVAFDPYGVLVENLETVRMFDMLSELSRKAFMDTFMGLEPRCRERLGDDMVLSQCVIDFESDDDEAMFDACRKAKEHVIEFLKSSILPGALVLHIDGKSQMLRLHVFYYCKRDNDKYPMADWLQTRYPEYR